MRWVVITHIDFEKEFEIFPKAVQDSIAEKALFLQEIGYNLGRPHVDTLKASKHANMKELRVDVKSGVWRVAFVFDPKRQAIFLVAGNKAGKTKGGFMTD